MVRLEPETGGTVLYAKTNPLVSFNSAFGISDAFRTQNQKESAKVYS
jgi:hypothetical protein